MAILRKELVTVEMILVTAVDDATGEVTSKIKPDMGMLYNGKTWDFATYDFNGRRGICVKPRGSDIERLAANGKVWEKANSTTSDTAPF